MKREHKGFAAIEVALVVVVILAIVGFVAWRILNDQANTNSQTSQNASNAETVAPITTQNDLNNVEKQLDETQVDDNTASELENETNF